MCWGSNVLSAVLDADYSTTGIGSTPGNSGILTPNAQTHAACLEWFKRASVWLDSHESRWRGVSDTEYWAPMLRGAIKKFYEQGESQVNEGEWFALVAFCRTDDAESAAPLLAQLIAEHHAWHDGRARVVLPLIEALKLYAGPLRAERDRNPDLAEVKKDQHDALDWWQKNKNKRPVYWVLDALARRGYATSNPADVQTTANALVSAPKKGERADRYLASRVMAYALPDGDGIPSFEQDIGFQDPRDPPSSSPAVDFMHEWVLCRAMRWSVLECNAYQWNSATGRYEPNGSTRIRQDSIRGIRGGFGGLCEGAGKRDRSDIDKIGKA